jgi:hypothetical protein
VSSTSVQADDRILGERLNVIGVVDRDQQRADKVLAAKRADSKAGYSNTRIFKSLDDAGAILVSENILPK